MVDYDYSIQYSRLHNSSEAHAEEASMYIAERLAAVTPKNRDARVLDIGCGYGFALRALRKLGFEDVLGLEISPQQAAQCQRAGFSVEVTSDSAGWLDAHQGSFDFVLLMDVLEHVPHLDQITFAGAVYRALKPGGRVYLTVPNASSPLNSRWLYNDWTHHSSFTEHSLHFVLKNAGFDSISIDASKGLDKFPSQIWRRSKWPALRKWIVRWCWLQVMKAEFFWIDDLSEISFELNLTAVAEKRG
jgi:2-polyprenyl-3-methyl-5-hydroxy-6-metoxy-1,4-benzoquinol methylase